MATGQPVSPAFEHHGSLKVLRFSPDLRRILAVATDQSACLWDTAPDDRPVDDLVLLTEVLTGQRLDEAGNVRRLGPEEWRPAWDRLRERYPRAFATASPAELCVWHRYEANECRLKQNWFAARWHLDRLLAAGSTDGWLHYRRGQAQRELGEPEKAVADFSRAIELGEDRPSVWEQRGTAYMGLEEWKKARADLTQALHREPGRPGVHFKRGKVSAERGQWQRAVDDFSGAIERGEKEAEIWVRRGTAYMELKEWEKAAADFTEAIRRQPDTLEVYSQRGKAYTELQDWQKAAADLTHVLERKEDLDLRQQRGWAYEWLAEWDKAEADYTRATDLAGMLSSGTSIAGSLGDAWAHGPLLAAAALFPGRIEVGGADAWLRGRRGWVAAQRGQWDKAETTLAQVVALNSDSVHAWYYRALVYLRTGKTRQYRELCAAMAQRFGNTDDPDAANLLAWTCVLAPKTLTDREQSIRWAMRAVAKAAKEASYVGTLGAALYRAEDLNQAVERLNESIALHAKGATPQTWLFLAMAHHRLGHAAEARRWLDKAIGSSARAAAPSWDDEVEISLLRREAEALLKKPATPR
jgi:tetratricopeptide (TPR) repeat protein